MENRLNDTRYLIDQCQTPINVIQHPDFSCTFPWHWHVLEELQYCVRLYNRVKSAPPTKQNKRLHKNRRTINFNAPKYALLSAENFFWLTSPISLTIFLRCSGGISALCVSTKPFFLFSPKRLFCILNHSFFFCSNFACCGSAGGRYPGGGGCRGAPGADAPCHPGGGGGGREAMIANGRRNSRCALSFVSYARVWIK